MAGEFLERTYGWDLAIGKGGVDAIELELRVHVLLLGLEVRWDVDRFRSHGGGRLLVWCFSWSSVVVSCDKVCAVVAAVLALTLVYAVAVCGGCMRAEVRVWLSTWPTGTLRRWEVQCKQLGGISRIMQAEFKQRCGCARPQKEVEWWRRRCLGVMVWRCQMFCLKGGDEMEEASSSFPPQRIDTQPDMHPPHPDGIVIAIQ